MKHLPIAAMAGLLALTACEQASEEATRARADMVFVGGTVYTVDGANSVAEAFAVQGDKIVFVGTARDAQAFAGESVPVMDITGKTVFPGFTDSHAHLSGGGETLLGLGLNGMTSVDEVLAAIRAYAEANPDMPVIAGSGWELNLFQDANPHKSLLDEIVPDRAVILGAADGHNGWVNSKALELAGITKDTPDPVNGRIERDADGNATGTLRESAQGLMAHILPAPTPDFVIRQLDAGLAYQAGHGITASIDAAIMADHNEVAYLAASERADLPQRVRVSLLAADEMVTSMVTAENVDEVVGRLKARREAYRARSKGRMDAEAVKIFVDGVAENHTAAMLSPYVNAPLGSDHRGDINLSEDAMNAYVSKLEAEGFQVHMHAIGDRAVRVALNAVEVAEGANGPTAVRHHISHLEVVQPDDIARFAPLGVTANLQALWHFNDPYISELTEPFLEESLHRWLYPARSFVEAGARIVWGSDWPVSTSDPFDSIEVAILRKDPQNAADPRWIAEESLSVDDMIRALTINGAWLMGQEDIRGSIEVGKQADFIIIDADPYKIAPEAISDISVLNTFIAGREVHTAPE